MLYILVSDPCGHPIEVGQVYKLDIGCHPSTALAVSKVNEVWSTSGGEEKFYGYSAANSYEFGPATEDDLFPIMLRAIPFPV